MEGSLKPSEDLVERVVVFARILRENGLPVTPSEAIDAALAALSVDPGDTAQLKRALRAALAKRREHLELFDELFERFWGGGPVSRPSPPGGRVRVYVEGEGLDAVSRFLGVYSPLEVIWRELGFEPSESPHERRRYYGGLKTLRRALALYEGRRSVRSPRGRIDFKRSMRASLKTYGEMMSLARSRRKKSKSKLVALVDVSNSMKDYWGDLYHVVTAFKGLPSGSYEVFLFSTRLVRVTDKIAGVTGPRDFIELIVKGAGIWGSGTRIGESLKTLLDEHPWVIGPRTSLIIASDGWDLGDLSLLEDSLRRVRRRAGYMLWATPHASSPDFVPATACLLIASRYVDSIIPLSSLRDQRFLRKIAKLGLAAGRARV